VVDEMYEPTLERTQAFFLLGIAEWGKGARMRSSVSILLFYSCFGYVLTVCRFTWELQ
jgi:hypothetical protein